MYRVNSSDGIEFISSGIVRGSMNIQRNFIFLYRYSIIIIEKRKKKERYSKRILN